MRMIYIKIVEGGYGLYNLIKEKINEGGTMYNLSIIKQLTNNKQHRLGSHERQHLLFSLVHLTLC